jgi:hypothetical protein
MKRKPDIKPSEWKRRRHRLDLALFTILVWVSWILWKGQDLALYQQSAIALIAGGVALLGQYVFGAVWDDKNYMNALASLHQPDTVSEPVDGSSGMANQIPGDNQTDSNNSGSSSNE